MKRFSLLLALVSLRCLAVPTAFGQTVPAKYLDYDALPDQLSGGSQYIPIETSKGTFHVWVKRIGNNPTEKVLILDGGPGMTHESLEAVEYALKYQQHWKGLIISDMMSSIPAYNEYAKKVLQPEMDQTALHEILMMEKEDRTEEPRYMELRTEHYYTKRILRMPPDQWPDGVLRTFAHMNHTVYVTMQGPSEMGASGRLEHWDRSGDLGKITVPTLTIGARYDTMDPKHLGWVSHQVKHGRSLYCPDGSHLCIYDDQKTYFDGLIRFIKEVDSRKF